MVHEPWASPRVVVEDCNPLHLALELVESQGELLCVGVKEGPDRSVGPGIETCIGFIKGPLCIFPPLVYVGARPLGLRPDATSLAPGAHGLVEAYGPMGLLLALLVW